MHASTDSMVPGSRGIGKPPGAVEVSYTLGSRSDVSAKLRGPVSGTLLEESQAPGAHVLRFNGVISAGETLPNYNVVRRVVRHDSGVDVFVLTLLLVTLAAYLSYRYFESPILRHAKRFRSVAARTKPPGASATERAVG